MPWALDVLWWLHALLWAYFAALAGLAVIALAFRPRRACSMMDSSCGAQTMTSSGPE